MPPDCFVRGQSNRDRKPSIFMLSHYRTFLTHYMSSRLVIIEKCKNADSGQYVPCLHRREINHLQLASAPCEAATRGTCHFIWSLQCSIEVEKIRNSHEKLFPLENADHLRSGASPCGSKSSKSRTMLNATLSISEFLASNSGGLRDEDGRQQRLDRDLQSDLQRRQSARLASDRRQGRSYEMDVSQRERRAGRIPTGVRVGQEPHDARFAAAHQLLAR